MKLIALVAVLGLFLVPDNATAAVKSCQSPAEIKAHLETNVSEEFCYHKVIDPTTGLVSGQSLDQ